jgi:hypothetical protein
MNDTFRKQISNIEDLVEISEILSESTVLLESISKYMKHPFDPQFSKDGHHIPMNFDKKGDTIYLLENITKDERQIIAQTLRSFTMPLNTSLLQVLINLRVKAFFVVW